MDKEIIIPIIFLIIIIFLAFYYNSKSLINCISKELIKSSISFFNSSEGQIFIDSLYKKLNEKIKDYPLHIRIIYFKFLSKKSIITILENSLNLIQKEIDPTAPNIDIKGNESNVSLDINFDNIQLNYENSINESDFEIYGNIKAETNFKDDPNLKAEIGFKKKF